MNEKLYYITDTYGTYYGMNSGNKLGAVTDIEHAQKFTLVKANNWIQKMARPMQRYQYILREAPVGEEISTEYEDVNVDDYYKTRFDEMDTDWNGYIEDLISFSSQLRQYQTNLKNMQ